VKSDDALAVAYPKDVATKVNAYVAQIEKILGKPLRTYKDEVDPSPCGEDENRRKVKVPSGQSANPTHDSWYVDYSPYSIGVISDIDVPTSDSIAVSITRVRDGLQKAGWHIVEFNSWTDRKAPTLKAEAPEKRYGATLEGVTTDPAEPKIGLNFSSPCFRHPDEEQCRRPLAPLRHRPPTKAELLDAMGWVGGFIYGLV
jgi:hypothetical protein